MYALVLLRCGLERNASLPCWLRRSQSISPFLKVEGFIPENDMSQFFVKTASTILPGALLVALLASVGCGSGKDAKAAAPQAMPVKVQTAKAQKVDDTTDYVATLKSRDSAVVMPQVEGIITQIFVHSGERVAAGAPSIQIDPEKQQ